MECNWPAVQVYLACQWQVSIGFGGAHWFGIPSAEVLAAMCILRIKPAKWHDTQQRVRVMVNIAQPLKNERASK